MRMNADPKMQRRPIAELHPHPDNPRQGDVGAIAESLEANGQYAPIVARPDGTVLAGAHRLRAAEALGWTDILVVTVDVDDATAKRIVLADNRTSDRATYDDNALRDLLESLATESDLTGTGWELDDLDDLNALLQENVLNDPQPVETDPRKVSHKRSLAEYADAYRDKAVRSIILDYRLDQFAWVTSAADRARADLGCASFADLFVALLAQVVDEQPPGS